MSQNTNLGYDAWCKRVTFPLKLKSSLESQSDDVESELDSSEDSSDNNLNMNNFELFQSITVCAIIETKMRTYTAQRSSTSKKRKRTMDTTV